MLYPKLIISNNFIKPDIETLTNQFFQGELLTIELSERIYNNINFIHKETYIQCVNKIKQILNHSRIKYYNELVIIKFGVKITEYEQMVLIRFLNLSSLHKNKIIILNNVIIFIPENLRDFGTDVLDSGINYIFKKYIKTRKTNIFIHRFSIKRIYTSIKLLLKKYYKSH